MVMALMLLLTAALNFANMTIAVCNRRLRKMGVRKVMGGTRIQPHSPACWARVS